MLRGLADDFFDWTFCCVQKSLEFVSWELITTILIIILRWKFICYFFQLLKVFWGVFPRNLTLTLYFQCWQSKEGWLYIKMFLVKTMILFFILKFLSFIVNISFHRLVEFNTADMEAEDQVVAGDAVISDDEEVTLFVSNRMPYVLINS